MDAFEALADDTRRRILLALAAQPRTAGELAADEPHSRPAVSRHLRVLREAALVRAESIGRTRVYSLELGGLAPVREMLGQLDAGIGAVAMAASRRSPAASGPIASERLDGLDLEVRRATRAQGNTEREEIA